MKKHVQFLLIQQKEIPCEIFFEDKNMAQLLLQAMEEVLDHQQFDKVIEEVTKRLNFEPDGGGYEVVDSPVKTCTFIRNVLVAQNDD